MVMKLKPSYSSATPTSDGRRSVRSHSMAPASRSAIVVRSSHWSHDGRPLMAVPTAATSIGVRRSPDVASARETMRAVAPSAGTSQSNRQSGDEIMRAAR